MANFSEQPDISVPPAPQAPDAVDRNLPTPIPNDSTYNSDPTDRVAQAGFRTFVADHATDVEGQQAARDFWGPLTNTLSAVGQAKDSLLEPAAANTEAGLGTIQAADLESRRNQIMGPGPTSVPTQDPSIPRTIPDWFRNQTPSQSIVKQALQQQGERKRVTDFENSVQDISQRTGLPVNDWRVIMNAGGRMREQNPSTSDALAAGALNPINLALAPLGDARTVSKIADIARGVGAPIKTAATNLAEDTAKGLRGGINEMVNGQFRTEPANGYGSGIDSFTRTRESVLTGPAFENRGFQGAEVVSRQRGLPNFVTDEGGSVDFSGPLSRLKEAAAKWSQDQGGSLRVDKVIKMLQGSKDPGTRALADDVSRMVLDGKSDAEIYDRLKGSSDAFAVAKEAGLADSVAAGEKKMSAVVENMARKGSHAEVEGLDVVSAGSRKRINSEGFNTQAEAQAYADEINKRVATRSAEITPEMRDAWSRGKAAQDAFADTSKKQMDAVEQMKQSVEDYIARGQTTDTGAEVTNIRTSFTSRGGGLASRLSEGQKSQIADIVKEHMGGEGNPSQVKAIVDELLKANDTVRNQTPIGQATAFDPEQFGGTFTKPGDFSAVKETPTRPSIQYVLDNFPPDQWEGQLANRTPSEIRQILLEQRMNKPNLIQEQGTGAFDARPNNELFGNEPMPGELGTGYDGGGQGPTYTSPTDVKLNQMRLHGEQDAQIPNKIQQTSFGGDFTDAKDFVNLKGPGSFTDASGKVSPVGDVQQAMIDQGFGMTGGGGRIRGLQQLANGQFWDNMLSTPRQLKAMGDLSALFNQGAIPFIAHNPEWREFAANSAKSLLSEQGYRDVIQTTKNIPTYDLGRRFGLASGFEEDLRPLASAAEKNAANTPVSARYEAFQRGVAREIPVLGKLAERSDKAYEAGLANLRANIFDSYANAWNLPQRLKSTDATGAFRSVEEIAKAERTTKALADFVNSISGYGHLGIAENAAPFLNEAFFAPRFFASRINSMFAPFTYTAKAAMGQTDWKLAYLAWRDMGMYSGGVVGTMKLAKAAGMHVEDDPRSARFGQIQVGDHYIDVTGGMGRTVAAFNQSLQIPPFQAEVKTGSGRIAPTNNPEFGDRNGFQIMLSWVANKANVIPGEAIDLALLGNRNVVNEPLGVRGHIPMPIGIGSVLEAASNDYQKMGLRGAVGGALTATPSLLGFGVNTYQLGEKQPEVLHGFPEDQLTKLTGIGKPKSNSNGGSFY